MAGNNSSSLPKSAPITFVLIHGAWHSGKSWNGVRKHLEAGGHEVHTPTVAYEDADGKVVHSLDEAVAPIIEYIEEKDLKDFVILGHSFGGVIITHLATKIPGRIKRAIYQNAFICADGESLMDMVPQLGQDLYNGLADAHPDKLFPCPFPIFREAFIGDGDIELAKRVYDSLRLQPMGQWKEKIQNSAEYYSNFGIPKAAILAVDDAALPTGGWAGMIGKLGVFRTVTVSGSHEVMFTDPEGLAKGMVLAGRD